MIESIKLMIKSTKMMIWIYLFFYDYQYIIEEQR